MGKSLKVQTTVSKIIKSCGGQTAIGNACGISRQAVEQWRKVPAEYVLIVEGLSDKYDRYQMRPDVFGKRPSANRGGAAA